MSRSLVKIPSRLPGPNRMAVAVLMTCAYLAGAAMLSCESGESTMSDEKKLERIEILYQKYHRKFPEVEGITAEELMAELGEGADLVLVDVRKPEEQAVSMIPGALTQSEFEEQEAALAGRTVITYCTAGYRSGLYAKRLQKMGWHVLNLEGSLLAWTHAGGTLVDAEGTTNRIHVYSPDWSLEASGYEPVW